MKTPLQCLGATVLCLAISAVHAEESGAVVDLTGYRAEGPIAVKHVAGELHASRPIGKEERGVLVLDSRAERPLIAALKLVAAADAPEETIIAAANPVTYLTVGTRDLSKQGWNAFFDNPPRRPHKTYRAALTKRSCRATSHAQRVTIALGELTAGPFRGELEITLYPDTPLVHVQAVLSTEQDACAILYDAGIHSAAPTWERIAWVDAGDKWQRRDVKANAEPSLEAVRRRTIMAEGPRGTVAIFPPPHQYLYPLDFADNFKFVWHGAGLHGPATGAALGVRQPPEGDKRFVPWINAPPGTRQRLGVFYLLSRGDAAAAYAAAGRFTRNDTFLPLPGYRTFTSHYHIEHTLDFLAQQREQGTRDIPHSLKEPSFVKAFQDRGVEIVHLAEFHVGHTPDFIRQRLLQLDTMHKECRRLSNEKFLLLPGEEPNVHLGGHWISFFPKPVYWLLHPDKDVPFETEYEGLGTVYAVHNAEDVLRLMEKENGLMWTAHPRTKSSFDFPDKYRLQKFYRSDRFLGAAWKAMPADLSHPRLGMRVLNLFDDMANWGQQKYVLGEVDVFKVKPDYELYGHMNVNYLKLDRLPRFDDGWQPVLDALRGGKFFVTTGEVLIPDFRVNGKESGETIALADPEMAHITAALEWTFPPTFAEIIWGDGENVKRHRIDLAEHAAFGKHKLDVRLPLPGAKWVRLEAWDIAANGAFTQPVWVK